MRELIRSTVWTGFAEIIDDIGGDSQAILAEAGVDPALFADPELYLPLRQFLDVQTIAARQLGRNDIGLLLGQRQTIDNLGPLAIAIANAETARRAIEVLARYIHVHSPANALALTPLPRSRLEFLSSTLTLKDPTNRIQNDERIISGLHTGIKTLAGKTYRPQAVRFLHSPVSPLSTYRRVFGITPEFNCPAMGIVLDRNALDSWRPDGSVVLRKIGERFLDRLDPPEELSLSRHVESMARSLLHGGEFTPEQTARTLGMHPRTLQRRLKEEGSSFEKIKDRARKSWAEILLVQPSLPLTQIAGMLGYADSSAFSRSCRRWFGMAPRTFRARQKDKRGRQGTPDSRVNSLEANLRARRRAGV
jgi:AraC-like DNA-binding protein